MQRRPDSIPETPLIPSLLRDNAGSIRGNRKQWIVYALLACLLVGAVSSITLGNSLRLVRSWLSAPAKAARDKSPQDDVSVAKSPETEGSAARSSEQEISRAKSPRMEAPQRTTEAAAKAPVSAPPANENALTFREGITSSSSSAAATRAPRPKLPAEIQANITSDNTVDVRVLIDSAGRVVDAKLLSIRGPAASTLAPYSVATARQWRFQPARQNGRPVTSGSVLEFLFRPSDILVSRLADRGR